MGKIRPPAPPDYTPVANASREAAEISAQVAREQLAWAREVYANDRQLIDSVLAEFIPQMRNESEAGRAARERLVSTYQPLEDDLIRQAQDYASPQRQGMEMGRAVADVMAAANAQREAALARLESFGIDPSQARAGSLDAAFRTITAGQAAGAANEARRQTELIGRGMLGEMINVGRGYPSQISQAYATSQQAGAGSVGMQLQGSQVGGQLMGTAPQWTQMSNSALGAWGNQVAGMNNAYYGAIGEYNRAAGSALGGVLGGITGLLTAPVSGLSGSVGGAMARSLGLIR